jgi:hypothetical protein
MRCLILSVKSSTSSSVTVEAPLNANLAPPGYYYIHVINNSGIPSAARIIKIPGSGTGGNGGGGGGTIFYDVPSPGDAAGPIYAGSNTRYGEEARTSSVLIGRSLKTWKVRLRRSASASGTVSATVRNSAGTVVATFNETFNASSLSTSYAERTFTLTTPRTIQAGDRILVEYSGPARVDIEAHSTDKFDGSNTRRVRYDGTSYIGASTVDVVGTMSS